MDLKTGFEARVLVKMDLQYAGMDPIPAHYDFF